MFGARGDGRTNDTQAFAALGAHISKLGGGTIALRPVTYIVGEQSPSGRLAFTPSDILNFVRCSGPIVIRGNGATLRCAPGLRYGGFDRSGRALPMSRANLQLPNKAMPYSGMIVATRCSGSIDISNLELDGNLGSLQVGGQYADHGWEAGGSGIVIARGTGPVTISQVHSHHHPSDGMLLMPAVDNSGSIAVTDVNCEYNARQGCTVSSGRNFTFRRCKFNHTGRAAPLYGNRPGAGVDVEAEAGPIRDVAFYDCEFSDNAGRALVAGRGNAENVTFDGCKLIGTTNWAAWPDQPGYRFNNCLFVGQIVHVYADPNPSRAAQFVNCTFTDDPSLSPTGKAYLGRNGDKAIAILTEGPNVSFSECRFRLVADGVLPESQPGVIYSDCQMSQRSGAPVALRGTFVGTNSIQGNVHLEGSDIRGSVTLNGRLLTAGR